MQTAPGPQPDRGLSSSACDAYREVIDLGLSRGRNAMPVWQNRVDGHGFTAGYQSVKRFVNKLRGSPAPEARAVIGTVPAEDYGGPRVVLRTTSAAGGFRPWARRLPSSNFP